MSRARSFFRGVSSHAAIAALSCLCACGSVAEGGPNNANTTGNSNDTNATKYDLVINNQLNWCDVTATVNGTQVAHLDANSATVTIQVAAGTTVNLNATPLPSFQAAQWTGTTSATSPTTYVMTTATGQTVTAYCPS